MEEKSSPQNKNMKRVPAPAQVEGTPPAEEVGNISDSGSGIIRIPVPLVMSKEGENGQAITSRPPRRSRSMTSSSDTGSSSGSKRSRSSSSSSMSSSACVPASKRRRTSSSTVTTESESDDHKVEDTAKNNDSAPAGITVAATANAVEVSAEKQVPEGSSTSTESEMENDFSALGLCNNEAGSDMYYLVIKCSAATIANRHHMMAVLEQFGDYNAQEGTDNEGIVV